MKKLKYWGGLFLFAALVFCACNDDEDNGGGGTPGGDSGQGAVSGVMTDLQITGHVRGVDGTPIAGVKVTSGTSEMTTNSSGLFTFSKIDVVARRSLVRFTKDGYFSVVRSLPSAEGDWEVVMCAKGDGNVSVNSRYSSDEGKTINVGGMRIEFPEDGYMNDENGDPYRGAVTTDMVYLDPNNENFAEMMPGGDLAAQRTDGSQTMLLSYGMTAVNMTGESGQKLQLKKGSKATLTFPVPEGMDENLPESIPLWSFNEQTGLWDEEGVAVLQDGVYVGQVEHFSWVNLDYPEEEGTIKGYVRNTNGAALAGIRIQVGQISVVSDSKGYYESQVPAGVAFELKVNPGAYGNYSNIFARPVMPLKEKEERQVDITLPTLHRAYGRIVNKSGGTPAASVWIEYGANKRTTKSVTSNSRTGNFSMYIPEGYSGEATLKVQDAEGSVVDKAITLAGSDLNLGDIVINSELGDGGIVDVTLSDGGTASFEILNAGEEAGVIVVDNRLMYMGDEEPANGIDFYLNIDGYEEGKTSYDDAEFAVENTQTGEAMSAGYGVSANVTEKKGKFVFNLSGGCNYYNPKDEVYDQAATFTSVGLTLDLMMKARTLRNVAPLQSGFPSFTPVLSRKSPLALLMTESKMCNLGGIALYNGTPDDYKTLRQMADKSGVKLVDQDDDEDGYCEATYFSNKKFIYIEYDPEAADISSEDDYFDVDSAPITVTVMDGLNESMLGGLMSGAAFAKSVRSAVRKRR